MRFQRHERVDWGKRAALQIGELDRGVEPESLRERKEPNAKTLLSATQPQARDCPEAA